MAILLFTAALAVANCPLSVRAAEPFLTPESPEVIAAVDRALEFLAKAPADKRPGARALVGLSYVKHNKKDHPKVQEALDAVREIAATDKQSADEIYTISVAIVFLTSLDPKAHKSDIEQLLARLISRQKPHGGFGYFTRTTGDTSMTQNAVLAMWEAAQYGIDVPLPAWERVTEWLLQTQDSGGGFGYQGEPSGGGSRRKQNDLRPSMAAAGLGSLYICQDYLGLSGDLTAARSDNAPPPTVRQAGAKKSGQPKTRLINGNRLVEAQEFGHTYWETNFKPAPRTYRHYYLYAYERYRSFEELITGTPEDAPQWYHDCARPLLAEQQQDGSWSSANDVGATCDTAFAALFLLRSTKKSLKRVNRFGSGRLIGGRGLPGSGEIDVERGTIRPRPLRGPAEELLKLLSDADNPEHEAAAEGFRQLALEADQATLNKHAAKLRQLAGAEDPEARLAAVRALGRTHNLDNVPTLIYALTDPDPRVFLEAREALLFLSRKFDGFGFEGVLDEVRRKEEIERWKSWYLVIRPDAKFED
ncbi:MAG: HEAT repeat domain-containing protein [Pirellulales bacterium]|nr:HEAT repeat domain-containing protein [Pirellulales bacterium]